MPLYEYRCTACRKRVTVLTLRASETVDATCDRCGSTALERLMSRFAMVRSEEARLDALSDPSTLGDLDENDQNDPKSMARWMKRMGGELGDELGGDELDEMVDSIGSGDAGDDDMCAGGGCGGDVDGDD
jgi:putative FmdB family regulatory protein